MVLECAMTAAKEAKEFGFASLAELAVLSGFSVRKLYTIHRSNKAGFKCVMLGAWQMKCNV